MKKRSIMKKKSLSIATVFLLVLMLGACGAKSASTKTRAATAESSKSEAPQSKSSKSVHTVNVESMGTLQTLISAEERRTITSLKVTGNINKADFEVMKYHMPKLTHLDLSDAVCENNEIPFEALGGRGSSGTNNVITSFVLPTSITSIGESAFRNCKNITSYWNFPEGLTSIGDEAFYNCYFRTTVTLPESLVKIGKNAFARSLMTGLELGNNVTTIDNGAFFRCRMIRGEVTIPASVTSLGQSAFDQCEKVSAFVFPHTKPLPYHKGQDSYMLNRLEQISKVKVPADLVDTYKGLDGWKDHTIVAM